MPKFTQRLNRLKLSGKQQLYRRLYLTKLRGDLRHLRNLYADDKDRVHLKPIHRLQYKIRKYAHNNPSFKNSGHTFTQQIAGKVNALMEEGFIKRKQAMKIKQQARKEAKILAEKQAGRRYRASLLDEDMNLRG